MKKDIAIIGGSVGGCLAAYTAAKLGKRVVLTEETAWIGGQLTSQAVPPDEHQWIEDFGCTQTYRAFRNEVRNYYKRHYPLKEEAFRNAKLNPGNAWVSRIAHEPRVALNILYDMLQPYLANGMIELLLEHKVTQAEAAHDTVQHVIVTHTHTGRDVLIEADYFLDATELGDVLPLAGVAYTTGAEPKEETEEPNALQGGNSRDIQSITHVFALEYAQGENHTIAKPEQYDDWKSYRAAFLNHDQLSDFMPDPHTGSSKQIPLFTKGNALGLWEYRRIIDANQFEPGFFKGDISLVNWPQNDYWLGSIIDDVHKEQHLHDARQLSLSLLYWLQTEAPRDKRQKGYPELKLRPDIVGTKDGLAMHPYIRESRRIRAMHTVTEHPINADVRGDAGIKRYNDSVGIGAYRIDLHPTTETNRMFYARSYPFEIPLGSLIPVKAKNVIPACKNIGTTQLTNGCYRVHPAEWNIGEAAGALAVFALRHDQSLQDIYQNADMVKDLQQLLTDLGITLHWPEVGAF
ncbi:FAD-dependent oxidoreductase [Lentibacillus saliphilus]|uniref:FAD-dependent oxidoreductase n=1 Tax=Lentibacillus saliphilus TaxID=2737028 RepID=UPI001C30880F|nr:FAD-dependent oxidoreductase [Lentibacillus saliphilus]